MKSYSDYQHEARMAYRYFLTCCLGILAFAVPAAAAIVYGSSNYSVACAVMATWCGCSAAAERGRYITAIRRAEAVKPRCSL